MSQSDDSKGCVSEELSKVTKQLKELYFDVLKRSSANEDSFRLVDEIEEIKVIVNSLSGLLDLNQKGASGEKITKNKTEHTESIESGEKIISRRRKNSSYDFLLLEAFRWRETFGPIGQGNLLDLATAFDANTKKSSLVAKLNRWKNDKDWLCWSHPDDISITPDGEAERDRLYPSVKRDGDFDGIIEAFSNAWSITVNLG